jgi:hypothetical protein
VGFNHLGSIHLQINLRFMHVGFFSHADHSDSPPEFRSCVAASGLW